MKLHIFAVATEETMSSDVHTSKDDLTTQAAIETLIRDGHDIADIRVVDDSDTKPILVGVKS